MQGLNISLVDRHETILTLYTATLITAHSVIPASTCRSATTRRRECGNPGRNWIPGQARNDKQERTYVVMYSLGKTCAAMNVDSPSQCRFGSFSSTMRVGGFDPIASCLGLIRNFYYGTAERSSCVRFHGIRRNNSAFTQDSTGSPRYTENHFDGP